MRTRQTNTKHPSPQAWSGTPASSSDWRLSIVVGQDGFQHKVEASAARWLCVCRQDNKNCADWYKDAIPLAMLSGSRYLQQDMADAGCTSQTCSH